MSAFIFGLSQLKFHVANDSVVMSNLLSPVDVRINKNKVNSNLFMLMKNSGVLRTRSCARSTGASTFGDATKSRKSITKVKISQNL